MKILMKVQKRILSSFLIWASLILIISVIFLWRYNAQKSLSLSSSSSLSLEHQDPLPKTQKEITQEIIKKKIEKIQKKNALKWLITQWDSYFENNELSLALKSYLEVLRKNSKDTLVIEKIGDTYAAMKRFKNAQNYYKELSLTPENTDKILHNLLYGIDIENPIEKEKFFQTLWSLWVNEEQMYYYTTSFLCLEDFHACKKSFWEYFWQKVEIETNVMGPKNIIYPPLKGIQAAIQNYENFQLDEVYFKDALIIGQYFQDKMYPIALTLGEKLIQEKPDYKVILKIIAESHFELGNYEKAKEALSNYYKLDTSDPSILYMLWIIYSEEKDFVLSNIYFTKALEGGFSPSINARRNIVYNYFLLENNQGFLSSLQDLIEKEESVSQSDLRFAVYYHILYEDIITAKRYIHMGKKLFPTDGYFYGYAGFLLKEEKNYDAAKRELKMWLEKDTANPFVLLNLWILEKELWNNETAASYFSQTLEKSPLSDFAQQAQQELTELGSLKNSLQKIFE